MQPISIVIPTLNEADNLDPLFKRINESLTSAEIPYEIIVIDDHSTDSTAQIAKSAPAEYNVQFHTKEGTPGKAHSLMEGFAIAQYELVCMIDGDLQYPPEAIKLMYHKLQYCEADIVLTERIDNKTSPLRRLMSYTFNTVFTRMLFGINYDTQSGLKLFRKSILKTINIDPSPWTFDLEFIVRALEHNYVIVSQQISFSERNAGTPKLHVLSATKEIATGSLKLWRNSSSKRIKLSYQRSEVLQRSIHWAVAVAATTVLATTTFSGGASAQSTSPGRQTSSGLTGSLLQALQLQPSAPASVNTPKPGAVVATPTAMPVMASATNDQPVASTAVSTVASAPTTSLASQAAAPNTGASTAPASEPSDSTVATAVSSSTTGTSNDSSKDTPYYPVSKLSTAKTDQYHTLALSSLIIGVGFIVLSLISFAIRKITMRNNRQVYT